jgi:hypothetical protein
VNMATGTLRSFFWSMELICAASGGGGRPIVHGQFASEAGCSSGGTKRLRWNALGQAGWSFVNGDHPEIDLVPIFEARLAAGARVPDGWLGWLEQQSVRPAAERSRVEELFRRYGASS